MISSTLSVLHVVTDRDRRGAQVHAMDLAEGMARLGVETEVVALAAGQHGDSLRIDALGRRRRSPSTLRAIRTRSDEYDVVVAHGSATLSACTVALAGTRVPFVYRQISDPLYWAASSARRFRVAAMLSRAARVVALSESVAELLSRRYFISSDKIVAIPNAVPAGAWSAPDRLQRLHARRTLALGVDDFVVAYVGALVEEKGVASLLDAVGAVESTVLLVAGAGPEEAGLRRQADQAAPGRVHFLGSTDTPRLVMLASDVLVLASSAGESMPAVLIEAGLSALPVITTAVGAITDVVIDGDTGLVVPIGDDLALAGALADLRLDHPMRSRLGSNARRRCLEEFTIEAVSPRWRDLLVEVVHRDV